MKVKPVDRYAWWFSKDLDKLNLILEERKYDTTYTTRSISVPKCVQIYKGLIERRTSKEEIGLKIIADSDGLNATLLPKKAVIKLQKGKKELTSKDRSLYDFVEYHYHHNHPLGAVLIIGTVMALSFLFAAYTEYVTYFGSRFP